MTTTIEDIREAIKKRLALAKQENPDVVNTENYKKLEKVVNQQEAGNFTRMR